MTASDFLYKEINREGYGLSEDPETEMYLNAMLEFAKYHVGQALIAASENADADVEFMDHNELEEGVDYEVGIHRGSILNAYPDDKIK